MRRWLAYIAIAILTGVAGLYAYLTFANDPGHFWRELSGAQVTSNGSLVSGARVYKQPNGTLLVNLADDGWRIYLPEKQNIGLCGNIRHIPIPGYIYAYDCESKYCPCVMMNTVKTGVEAQLLVQPSHIEFNSLRGERIRVAW